MSKLIKCKNNFDEIVEIPQEKFVFRPSVFAVIKKDDSILLLNTKLTKKFWFPGGRVDIGETLHEALRREFQEETGLKLKTIKELLLFKENFFYYQPYDEAFQAFLFFYFCEAETGEMTDKGIEAGEDIENPRWVKIDELKPEQLADLPEEIMKMLKELN